MPSTNRSNGGDRDSRGRFVQGNKGGPGNPHGGKVAKLRSALLAAVSQKDLREIIARMVAEAKAGDVQAAKLVLDRCLGPAEAVDVAERLTVIERRLQVERISSR